MSTSKGELKSAVWQKLRDVLLECPECEYMTDDPQYTCTTCWCEGGQGHMFLSHVIEDFTLKENL